jgi:hypothetical protein
LAVGINHPPVVVGSNVETNQWIRIHPRELNRQ